MDQDDMKAIRPIRVEGDIAYVTLTRGYQAIIDATDVPLVEGRNWSAVPSGRCVYACAAQRIGGTRTTIGMHRLLLGFPAGLHVDHINADGLDNRRANLRIATPSQNQANSRKKSSNTSGLKGVIWDKNAKIWRSQIRAEGKIKHLGCFPTAQAAHAAYCKASAELHGEFGRTA